MGSRPHAVLVYGYDLTESMFDYDAKPSWYELGNGDDWPTAAERALLAAKEFIVEPGRYIDLDDVRGICGVELVRLRADDDIQGVLLAAKKHDTDWDTNRVIPHFVLADDVEERLKWALDALGIDPGERLPEWILASYHH